MKKVLVAVDFSEDSARAVRVALDVTAKFGARLLVLHVLHDPSETPGFYSAKKAGKKVWRNMEQSANEMMSDFVKAHVKTRRKFDVAIVPGLPAAQILRTAKKEEVDLIVIGTRGRSDWQRLLLGSVADHVVRSATCPVLAVPESSAERKQRERTKKAKRQKKGDAEGAGDTVEEAPPDGQAAVDKVTDAAEAKAGEQESSEGG